MLIGTWEQPIDPAGHLKLPAALHPLLAEGLVVTRSFDPCLQLFPIAGWRALAARVSGLPISGAPERRLRRLLFSGASVLSDAGDAMLSLSQPLRDYAGITTRVVIVGMDTYLEIWSPERWEGLNAEIIRTAGAWPESPISLNVSPI